MLLRCYLKYARTPQMYVRLLEAINHANAGFRVNTFYNYNNETRIN